MPVTLRALIDAEAPLRPARAVEITLQILDALRALRERRLAHDGLAPERIELDASGVKVATGRDAASPASDVRAAASILYELLTGARPDEDRAPVSQRTPALVSPRLEALVARALDEPHAFASPDVFAHELRVCLVDALGAARRPLRPPHRF